jgi:hypothetical protein
VEYFNPFRNIEIDPEVDLEELSKYAHSFGEVVGLGLRDLAHCPVEMNLMPKSSIQRQEFGQKKPYLIASVYSLALVVFAIYLAEDRIGAIQRQKLEDIKSPLERLTLAGQKLDGFSIVNSGLKHAADQMGELADERFYWIRVLSELRSVLMKAEAATKANLSAQLNSQSNTDVGVWVVSFSPVFPNGSPFAGGGEASAAAPSYPGAFPGMGGPGRGRYPVGMPPGMPSSRMPVPQAQPSPATPSGGNEIATINIFCRGVNRDTLSPSANSDLAYAVLQNLTNSPYFTEKSALANDTFKVDQNSNTFSFSLTAQLKQPFKL